MDFKDVWNKITGKPPSDKPEEKPKPPEQKPAAKPEGPSAAEQKKQAAKDRVKSPGPAERYLVNNPDVLQKAVNAKAEREKPKPTTHDFVPPTTPKPGPTVQTPFGPVRPTPPTYPPRPPSAAPPGVPRKPTNADRMLDRAKETLPPKPPPKSFRELHPNSERSRSR